MIHQFCDWLSHTPLSKTIQQTTWIIPSVQTVHILAIAVVMSAVVMIDARLLGISGRGQTLMQMAHRHLPWLWGAVLVLLASGAILIIGEPKRELLSQVFWLKMSLLAGALLLTGAFQRALGRHALYWEQCRTAARVLATVSLLLWVGILTAGRWIAYVGHR